MRHLLETLCGLYQLMWLMCRTRFRVRGPYWQWRYETAFGSDPARRPSRRAQLRAGLEYGRWIHRMKRRMG